MHMYITLPICKLSFDKVQLSVDVERKSWRWEYSGVGQGDQLPNCSLRAQDHGPGIGTNLFIVLIPFIMVFLVSNLFPHLIPKLKTRKKNSPVPII